MLDRFNRNINYLRISVTDRCNLRCRYCMPDNGIKYIDKQQILSFEEITEIVGEGIKLGINRIRLTGGEPLVRKGIVNLVEMLAALEGLSEITMTTNGLLLPDFAHPLAHAGLSRVNISLDTVDPIRYSEITRGGSLKKVFSGIEAAIEANLVPVKINCVVMPGSPKEEVLTVKRFAENLGLKVRFIQHMNLETGEFSLVEGGEGGNCARCNRLRLTANGYLKPCLFSDLGYNVRELGIKESFAMALGRKPKSGTFNKTDSFYNLGG